MPSKNGEPFSVGIIIAQSMAKKKKEMLRQQQSVFLPIFRRAFCTGLQFFLNLSAREKILPAHAAAVARAGSGCRSGSSLTMRFPGKSFAGTKKCTMCGRPRGSPLLICTDKNLAVPPHPSFGLRETPNDTFPSRGRLSLTANYSCGPPRASAPAVRTGVGKQKTASVQKDGGLCGFVSPMSAEQITR